jgi:DNA-binding XRE family transcriptional regulator
MKVDMNLAKRLRTARVYLDLSQEYVAKSIGISRTSLVAIEAGERKVTSEELKSFSNIYGWSIDELVYGRQENDKVNMFARALSTLSEQDQHEIMNLIEFKKRIKERMTTNV